MMTTTMMMMLMMMVTPCLVSLQAFLPHFGGLLRDHGCPRSYPFEDVRPCRFVSHSRVSNWLISAPAVKSSCSAVSSIKLPYVQSYMKSPSRWHFHRAAYQLARVTLRSVPCRSPLPSGLYAQAGRHHPGRNAGALYRRLTSQSICFQSYSILVLSDE